MKIHIGPYKEWLGPYQIAEKILFFIPKQRDESGFPRTADVVHNFGKWLSEDKNGKDSRLTKFCNWLEKKRNRKVKIHIDNYDTWNMNSTLAMIILPMLKQLKDTKHGAPNTDDKDAPVELRSTSAPKKEHDYDTDGNHFKRWDYILDEMIWTFEQLHPDTDWEAQYYSGEHDIVWEPKGELNEKGKPKFYEMKKGPKDTFQIDMKGMRKHQKRIDNGLRLFGKYYCALWD